MTLELEKIEALLRKQWDPIGVFPNWPGEDEYDYYALHIYSMLKGGATVDEVADYLAWAANKFIEVETIPEREIAVAQAAAAILAL